MSTRSKAEDQEHASLQAVEPGRYKLSGPLTFVTVPDLLKALDSFPQSAPITIDLADVTRGDSAAVALIVEWLRQARRTQAVLRFINVPEQIRAILRVSGLEGLAGIEAA